MRRTFAFLSLLYIMLAPVVALAQVDAGVNVDTVTTAAPALDLNALLAAVGQILAGLVTLASLVTAATSYPKAQGAIALVQRVLAALSVLTHKDSPGTLKLPAVASPPPPPKAPPAPEVQP